MLSTRQCHTSDHVSEIRKVISEAAFAFRFLMNHVDTHRAFSDLVCLHDFANGVTALFKF